jgi:hypothetical protein
MAWHLYQRMNVGVGMDTGIEAYMDMETDTVMEMNTHVDMGIRVISS